MATVTVTDNTGWRAGRSVGRYVLVLAVILLALLARAAQPRISLIEKFGNSQVTIHFDTEANRTYTLQYSTSVKSNGESTLTWSNLYTAPTLPFPDHYVIVDTRTAKQRFYRLQVTP